MLAAGAGALCIFIATCKTRPMNQAKLSSMLPSDTFKGHSIIITGGGSGLGKAMATECSKLGAKVAITSRSLEKLQKSADEISSETGIEVAAIACDITQSDQVDDLVAEVLKRFGRIDALVNNAAGNFISPTERLSANAFGKIIDIVLKGTAHCTMAVGKHWIAEKTEKAAVLNIATTYAHTGSGYVVPSACAKAGVVAMTKSLAVEWAQYNIRINAIAPGPFPTKGAWERLLPGELVEQFSMKERVPVGRVGETQELANLAAYLLSDYSAYINGEVVTMDGGEWLQGAGQFNMLKAIPSGMWDMLEAQIRSANKKKK